MKKRPFSMLLVLCMVLSLLPFSASAAEIVDSGTCGENLYWTLNEEGTLRFSGEGKIPQYWQASMFLDNMIKKLVIDEGVTGITHDAFKCLPMLETVELPDSLEVIEDCAFWESNQIKDVYFSSLALKLERIEDGWANMDIDSFPVSPIAYANWHYSQGADELIDSGSCGAQGASVRWELYGNGDLYISGTGAIADGYFYNENRINSVFIGEGVTDIGEDCFRNCFELHQAIFPNSLHTIGHEAFLYTLLRVAVIPEHVTTIDGGAFKYCPALESAFLPDSVFELGDGVFMGDGRLSSVRLPANITVLTRSLFDGCKSLESIEIPDSVKRIQKGCFCQCGLKSIQLPEGLEVLENKGEDGLSGSGVFQDCQQLEEITLPKSLKTIEGSTFNGCESLREIRIPEKVRELAGAAFYGCTSLERVELPANLESIDGSCFKSCVSLREIELPAGVRELGSQVFFGCKSLESLEIPDGVQALPGGLFFGCTSLREIKLPASVTEIGYEVFSGCNKLQQVPLPKRLTSIGKWAFQNCAALESLCFPASLRSIGQEAFVGCSKLRELRFLGDAPEINNTAFPRIRATAYYYQDRSWPNEKLQNYGGNITWIETERILPSGSCGENLTWTLRDDGSLLLSGTGRMRDFSENNPAPWFDLRDEITGVIVPAGVTGIGSFAFQGCADLQNVYYGASPEKWNAVSIGNQNAPLLNARVYFYADGPLTMPTISAHPKTLAALEGDTVSFSVKASGGSLEYQWQYQSPGSSVWKDSGLTGAKTATISVKAIESRNGQQYRCIVSNEIGSVTSDPATLTVSAEIQPTITTQPKGAAVASGDTVKFTVAAAGGSLTYQWQFKAPGGDTWNNSSMTGAKTATLTVEATTARNGQQYRCFVKNAVGSVTSSAATLTIVKKPTVSTQPKSVTAASGSTVKFTVAAAGGGLTYQWQFKSPGGDTWNNSSMTGAKTATLTVAATTARSGQQYRCVVKNAAGSVTSSAATLTVVTMPKISTQPKAVTAKAGDTVTFTVQATGGGLTYQWQFKASGTDTWYNSSMTGAKTATLTVEATTARSGQQYRCVVKNAAGSVTSSAATLTVVTMPKISAQPKSVTAKAGDTVTFTVQATGGNLTYQWQFKAPGTSTWYSSSMTGAKTATLTVSATEARNGQQYRCVVKNSLGSVTSDSAKLTVK